MQIARNESVLLPTDGFVKIGVICHNGLNLEAPPLPADRRRHVHGFGPFAKLRMPRLPSEPGLYLWDEDGEVVYVGHARMPLKVRLGSEGDSTISNYNTFAPEPRRSNGGQQTNRRINALANQSLRARHSLAILHRTMVAGRSGQEEVLWMRRFGLPKWNRRDER